MFYTKSSVDFMFYTKSSVDFMLIYKVFCRFHVLYKVFCRFHVINTSFCLLFIVVCPPLMELNKTRIHIIESLVFRGGRRALALSFVELKVSILPVK